MQAWQLNARAREIFIRQPCLRLKNIQPHLAQSHSPAPIARGDVQSAATNAGACVKQARDQSCGNSGNSGKSGSAGISSTAAADFFPVMIRSTRTGRYSFP